LNLEFGILNPAGQRRGLCETMPKWHSFTLDQTERLAISGGACQYAIERSGEKAPK